MSDVVIKVENLKKNFADTEVIKGVSFELRRSEILGLLGPNGAGKTTILHILMGLTTCTSGSIRILSMDINNRKERPRILKRINFSSTYTSLPYSLTVKEALYVFARLYEVDRPEERILEVSSLFGIEALMNREIRTLSSGQQTRLNLAKAFINDPEILLLDEPTASLDPDAADKTRRLIKEAVKKRNISIIYTSHNMQEMEEMADRIIFLNEGRIVAQGSVSEIVKFFNEKDLVGVFLRIARGRGDES